MPVHSGQSQQHHVTHHRASHSSDKNDTANSGLDRNNMILTCALSVHARKKSVQLSPAIYSLPEKNIKK